MVARNRLKLFLKIIFVCLSVSLVPVLVQNQGSKIKNSTIDHVFSSILDCKPSLFHEVLICFPVREFSEIITGQVVFRNNVSRVDMVGILSDLHHTAGASWEDPCAESEDKKECGNTYIFKFHPPPVSGIYNLKILWLCNFDGAKFVRQKRVIYNAPINFTRVSKIKPTQIDQPMTDFSLKKVLDKLYNLNKVRTIFFVGDSHMRKLFEHSLYLLTGYAQDFKKEIDIRTHYKLIELVYLKIEGIYDNGEFGCIGRGKFTGRVKFEPHGMKVNDIVLISEAHWTMAFCEKDKYSAYKYYLPKFLDFYSLENQKRKVFVTSPPWNSLFGRNTCKRRTNINLSWSNQIGASIARERKWNIFDAWSLLMPLYDTGCDPAHFSCVKMKGKRNIIYGTDIIVVNALWHYLSTF